MKKGKHVATHLHLNATFLLEANEHELLHIKPDENSDIKWFLLDEAVEASTERELQVVYKKLNEKLRLLQGK